MKMHEILSLIKTLGFAPNSVLDVGASNGQWSKGACKLFPDAHYYLIEPQSQWAERLQKNSSSFPNWSTYQIAAGNLNEKRQLSIGSDKYAASFSYRVEKSETVTVVRLDDLASQENWRLPDLVKMDLQGWERQAIEGCPRIVENAQILVLELGFQAGTLLWETVAWMAERFQKVPFDMTDVLRRPFDNSAGQVDVFFIDRDHPLRDAKPWK